MKIRVKVFVLGFALVCLAAGSGYAQQPTSINDTSLGDIARKLKAQKAKEHQPTWVITNDTIVAPKDGAKATTPKKGSGDASEQGSGEKGHDAEYFRSRQTKIQDQLDTHKRELDVLQQKLGLNQTQYYPNPQDSLLQQYTRADIDKRTADIDAKKQQIADDEKAMEGLREQLRREGGDPSWLRQ